MVVFSPAPCLASRLKKGVATRTEAKKEEKLRGATIRKVSLPCRPDAQFCEKKNKAETKSSNQRVDIRYFIVNKLTYDNHYFL